MVAHFTMGNLKKVCGDDWNDKPYDCNAGIPQCDTFTVCFTHPDYYTPAELNSGVEYCVDDIIAGRVPWLTWVGEPYFKDNIMAGCTYDKFRIDIMTSGGSVYEKLV
jgi:hypothetical protein